MHVPINVKSPNNISKWQMGFNSAFKGLSTDVLSTAEISTNRFHGDLETSAPFYDYFSNYALQLLKAYCAIWVRLPTFATWRLDACHHARALSGGRWNCGREILPKCRYPS